MDDESKYCNKCGAQLVSIIEKMETPEEQPIQNVLLHDDVPLEQTKYVKPKNNKGCLTVFLWVFLLPIMAIITIAKSKRLKNKPKAVFITLIVLFYVVIFALGNAGAKERPETAFTEVKTAVENKEYVKAQEKLNQYLKDYPGNTHSDEAKALLEQVNPEADKIKAERQAEAKEVADKAAAEKAAADKAAADKATAGRQQQTRQLQIKLLSWHNLIGITTNSV